MDMEYEDVMSGRLDARTPMPPSSYVPAREIASAKAVGESSDAPTFGPRGTESPETLKKGR